MKNFCKKDRNWHKISKIMPISILSQFFCKKIEICMDRNLHITVGVLQKILFFFAKTNKKNRREKQPVQRPGQSGYFDCLHKKKLFFCQEQAGTGVLSKKCL